MLHTTKTALYSAIGILLLILCVSLQINAQVVDSSNHQGWERKTIFSKLLNENRKINIQLPTGLNPYDKYPVLYVLDGEALTSMVVGQVNYLSESYKIIPKLIIVTIENTDRTRDLTPTHSIIGPDGKPDTSINAFGKRSGGGEHFLQFIKEELMPYIEKQYPAERFKILAGHSLGGLMAIHCLINHPDYFNAYIAISPSLQWDSNATINDALAKATKWTDTNKILFFSDANEDALFHQNQVNLDTIFSSHYNKGLQYKRLFYPEETHVSEPIKAFYDGMRFVYPNWHLPYNSSAFRKTMRSKMIIDHYTSLSKIDGYKVSPLHD
ncbi:MAG: alpha/beta hydrolase, partial [Flavobacterium sp.]